MVVLSSQELKPVAVLRNCETIVRTGNVFLMKECPSGVVHESDASSHLMLFGAVGPKIAARGVYDLVLGSFPHFAFSSNGALLTILGADKIVSIFYTENFEMIASFALDPEWDGVRHIAISESFVVAIATDNGVVGFFKTDGTHLTSASFSHKPQRQFIEGLQMCDNVLVVHTNTGVAQFALPT